MPSRPVGSDSAAKYHQRLWDVVNSLSSRHSSGRRISNTTRGVIHHADLAQPGSSAEKPRNGLAWAGYYDRSKDYKKDDMVAVIGLDPNWGFVSDSANNDTNDNTVESGGPGLYVALEDVAAGTLAPVANETTNTDGSWQLIIPLAFKKTVWRGNEGVYVAIPNETINPSSVGNLEFGVQIQNFPEDGGHDDASPNPSGRREINISLAGTQDTDDIDIRSITIPVDGGFLTFRTLCTEPVFTP